MSGRDDISPRNKDYFAPGNWKRKRGAPQRLERLVAAGGRRVGGGALAAAAHNHNAKVTGSKLVASTRNGTVIVYDKEAYVNGTASTISAGTIAGLEALGPQTIKDKVASFQAGAGPDECWPAPQLVQVNGKTFCSHVLAAADSCGLDGLEPGKFQAAHRCPNRCGPGSECANGSHLLFLTPSQNMEQEGCQAARKCTCGFDCIIIPKN